MRGAIFSVTVPATIMTSLWRGEGRKTPAPKRSRSKREAPVAIISIAQQARAEGIGQGEDLRAQLKSQSREVVTMLGSKRPCRRLMGGLLVRLSALPDRRCCRRSFRHILVPIVRLHSRPLRECPPLRQAQADVQCAGECRQAGLSEQTAPARVSAAGPVPRNSRRSHPSHRSSWRGGPRGANFSFPSQKE